MPFDLGATARLTAQCVDPGGAPATAGSVAVTVTLPDGTEAAPAATETATSGTYQADYVTTVAGRHTVRWQFTDPAHAWTDVFDVWPEAPPAILSLADAKAHLNLTTSRDDAEVRFWNNAATRAVEFYTGPVVRRTVVEDHRVGTVPAVALAQTPVLEVTSVAALRSGGIAYDVGDLTLDAATGVLARHDGGPLTGPLRITYTAGRTVIAENITAAARIILEHLWRTQKAARGGLAGGGEDYSVSEPIPGLGYAVPNRALQLLEPDRLPPGVA
ncbi:phage gp6-like head-tail connector protein [Streptomyces sp. C1-2]|nr:phage gp6-like head-tail connector protein [Streptomyces sp. C1-2]